MTSGGPPLKARRFSLAALVLGVGLINLLCLSACKSGVNTTAADHTSGNGGATRVLPLSDQYRHRCANPRVGTDPYTQSAFADLQGSSLEEKKWLAAWSNEDYLWYRELPDLSPSGEDSTLSFFALLKTSAVTPSGKLKDSYHYVVPSDEYHRFLQKGTPNPAAWVLTESGQILLAENVMAEDGSQVPRGTELISIDDNANFEVMTEALLNPTPPIHRYEILPPDASASRIVSLTALSNNVQSVTFLPLANGGIMGYLHYKEHSFGDETALVDAVNQLKKGNITDLALDLRNNGGGAVYIASVVASMIADPALTRGKFFERSLYNDKHPVETYPFFTEAYGISYPNGQLIAGALAKGTPLPNLGLRRLFVLTSGDTCSASESVINSLRGIDVEVIQIGTTTCGKPYGFLPQDNCGYTYSSINFQGLNAKGEGDYSDGLDPRKMLAGKLAGCYVQDSYRYPLGDKSEPLLAAAMAFAQTGTCPTTPGSPFGLLPIGQYEHSARLLKPAWQQNKVLGY